MKIENRVYQEIQTIDNKKSEVKVYSEPKIINLGAIQRVTLGGSPGLGDSGADPIPLTENPLI